MRRAPGRRLKRTGISLWKPVVVSVLLFVPILADAAEIYKWIDDDGTVHFSDSRESVPPSFGGSVKKIPVYEQNEIPKGFGHKEAEKTDRTVPNEEAVDRLLKRIWKEYRECLRRGDTEKALTYIHPDRRDNYREIFKHVKDKLPAIVQDEIGFEKESIEDTYATYTLSTVENGKSFAYEVRFTLDMGGHWKILEN